MTNDDPQLADAYRLRPVPTARGTRVDVEILQALADGSYVGPDRDALLSRVLADPDTAREFHFLLDVAKAAPPRLSRSWWTAPRSLALAAAALVAITLGGSIMRGRPGANEPMRGGEHRIQLTSPANAARLPAGGKITLTWSPLSDAVEYDVSVTAAEGVAYLSRQVADTTLTVDALPDEGSWWVTARLRDGTTATSPVRSFARR